jgi:HSP20 family protein
MSVAQHHPEEVARNGAKQPSGAESTTHGPCFVPAVDIVEKADELLLVADVPGALVDKIDVRYEDGELTLHAPAVVRRPAGRFWLEEYQVGDYYRSFRIGQSIDATRINAQCVDGVLTLHLPKVESVKPRRIAVKTP